MISGRSFRLSCFVDDNDVFVLILKIWISINSTSHHCLETPTNLCTEFKFLFIIIIYCNVIDLSLNIIWNCVSNFRDAERKCVFSGGFSEDEKVLKVCFVNTRTESG